MPVDIDTFIAPQRTNEPAHAALVGAAEAAIEKLLRRYPDKALTRQDIGNAFMQSVTGPDAEQRDFALLLAKLFPPTAELMKATTAVLDHALTNLVRRGAVHMALHATHAHFWTADRRPPAG